MLLRLTNESVTVLYCYFKVEKIKIMIDCYKKQMYNYLKSLCETGLNENALLMIHNDFLLFDTFY